MCQLLGSHLNLTEVLILSVSNYMRVVKRKGAQNILLSSAVKKKE